MISQLSAALLRAVLIAVAIATPSLLLPVTLADTAQIVIVLAILAAVLTFIEYFGHYPSVIEFRFAPPFNRLKFITLVSILLILSLVHRGQTDPTEITALLTRMAGHLGGAIDFPYSPVRLVLLMMPPDTDHALLITVPMAAGVSYAASITMILVFLVLVRFFDWPLRRGAFNVWINLPVFDPTAGGDVLYRMRRDATLNVVLGSLLPFLVPALITAAANIVGPISLSNPQTLIWTMTAWAFLPASMLMRGIALSRIASMIETERRRAYARAATEGLQGA